MEAAHRAALLAASCLRTPLDPRTRAPAALYERGPPPAAEQVPPGLGGVCVCRAAAPSGGRVGSGKRPWRLSGERGDAREA